MRLFAVALAVASMGCVCLYVEGMVNLFNRYGGLLDPPFFFLTLSCLGRCSSHFEFNRDENGQKSVGRQHCFLEFVTELV